jgi:carbamate kinase
METLVIALGGNAIHRPGQRGTTEEQFADIDAAARRGPAPRASRSA